MQNSTNCVLNLIKYGQIGKEGWVLDFQDTSCTGSNAPKPSITGSNLPHTPSACNPSAESGLASTYYLAPSSVYVEDDLDRVSKLWPDMTQELDRSYGYHGNQTTLLLSVGSVGPDPRLFEPALP
ncbi:hypothetical protein CRG98_029054 [Punica granatum]|uniref:Uncharacterized protein n=1 Tax=Punica granatum TaxID=22663 RepID=A0A2I0J2U0_PUNGR|nr:hypothetical protein CRG98_029054 [Punica granatum]